MLIYNAARMSGTDACRSLCLLLMDTCSVIQTVAQPHCIPETFSVRLQHIHYAINQTLTRISNIHFMSSSSADRHMQLQQSALTFLSLSG